MRPDTIHAAAQLVRHTRGLLTTIEKWIAKTPPEALPGEIAAVVALVRDALTAMNMTPVSYTHLTLPTNREV